MSHLERFLAYAHEFEKTFEDDDWQRLERFFAPDAVYEVKNVAFACRVEGREAILPAIRKSIDGFDRRMDQREIQVLAPPTEQGNEVKVVWAVVYALGDQPPLRISAHSVARYEGELITYLADIYDDTTPETLEWLQNNPQVDPSYQ